MKAKNSLFSLGITIMLVTNLSCARAMDLETRHLTADTMNDSSTSSHALNDNDNDNLHYPGNISFMLGYSRTNVNNANMTNVSVTESPDSAAPINSFQTNAAALNGITLGLNQFLSYHFGYEFNFTYYLQNKSSNTYSGVYDPGGGPEPANIVNANGETTTKLLTTELLGMGALHLTKYMLLVGKLGVGYARFNQTSTVNADFSRETDTYVPYNDVEKNNKFGIAGGGELRFDLNENYSVGFGINDLNAGKNFLAYQANLMLRL